MLRLIALFAVLLFCGCSGKSSSSSTYEIGIDPSWYPLQLADYEKNVLAFSIELLTTISKKENLELSIQSMNWNNLFWGLKEHKYNAVLSSMRPYAFYKNRYNFSDLYLLTGPVIVAPKNSPIKAPSDLKGKEVAVVRGSSAALILQTTPGIILKGYDSIPFALEAVAEKNVHAAALEVLIVQSYIRDIYQDTLKIIGPTLSDEGLRLVALSHESEDLLKRFNKGLMTLKESGEYEKLLKKWGLSPDGNPIANLDHEIENLFKGCGNLLIK
ncbi:MAG: transporter substrate-binding domain-containing protein [Simkaniaceae bacterium]|nr:transporter substrate-binding domain-containing protein [Candidatus Sacchlamyda saccharinae]